MLSQDDITDTSMSKQGTSTINQNRALSQTHKSHVTTSYRPLGQPAATDKREIDYEVRSSITGDREHESMIDPQSTSKQELRKQFSEREPNFDKINVNSIDQDAFAPTTAASNSSHTHLTHPTGIQIIANDGRPVNRPDPPGQIVDHLHVMYLREKPLLEKIRKMRIEYE
jgi:hypothetical protein